MNKNLEFVHLHVHTGFSLLDGSGKISKLISKAKELGMKSIAITDHGAMYGCVDFYKEAKDQGIKPIIGCEVYVASKSLKIKNNDASNETHHLVLLVKNDKGYANLMKIVSKASIDGFYYKPRVDHEYLKKHSEGLIALSACLAGEVQSAINKTNYEKAKEIACFYKDTFKDGFYLELQDHGMDEQLKVNEKNIQLSKELNIPLVATNDVHYIEKTDYKSHDVLLCIQTGKTVQEENRMKYPSDQFYLKSPKEMYQLFYNVPEALDNTVKIADQCSFDYDFHHSKLPNFPLDDGIDHFEYLKDLCIKGLKDKYENISDELKERLSYELGIIKQMGYVDYFLIVWDFMRFSREKGIPIGPGRGSAAGSIVAYTLGITKIDPIKYGLIFERFLNPERVSMPDIDSDFCYERRQEVIDYVVEKYGEQNVSQIITFGTMAAKACIRDVGRAMNYSYAEVDKIAKMIPSMLNMTIDKALDMNNELKELYEDDIKVKELIDISRSLEGLPRHTSTHAAGVVIASQPLVNYVPLQKNEESIVAQFTMGTLEELGLLKMDFLGLRTLTVMKDAVDMIKVNKGIDIDLDKIDVDDKEVYKMLGEGKTAGVFQLESPGMTSFMKELKPDSLEDIIAGISLYRPGPMAEIPKYIKNKKDPDNIEYDTPQLKSILDVSYGVTIYQEQVMEIVRKLAGYSMGRSDLVRRAMSKKKHKVMEEERHNFIYGITDENGKVLVPGCLRNGISEQVANKIFDSMMAFASYAFNKSHAAAYAVIAYQTAYLIKYYPTEFCAALLNSVMGNNEKIAFYVRFAYERNIKVLPPDINESFSKFTVKGQNIRFGLSAIKNVGVNVAESICDTRNKKGAYKGIFDFASKSDFNYVNKRAVESLIKAGAFDSLKVYRSKLLAVFEKLLDGVNGQRKKNIEGQMSLFGNFEETITIQTENYPDIKEFDKKYLLSMEKEMTGLYISGHPLDEYEEILHRSTSHKTSDILISETLENDINDEEVITSSINVRDGDKVIVGGIISDINEKITKNNNKMAFIKLEDLYGIIEAIIFPNVFQKFNKNIVEDGLVIVTGRISLKEGEQTRIICESIQPLVKINNEKIYILIEEDNFIKTTLNNVKPFFHQNKGTTPVYFCTRKERKKYLLDRELWLNNDKGIINHLKNIFGDGNVKVL